MTSHRRMSASEIASYAGACFKLALDAYERCADVRNVEAVLCEDGRTVIFLLEDPKNEDDVISVSFMVDEKLTEETFDQRKFCEGFWEL